MQEKTELEKLKNDFKDSTNIVFVDISLDNEKQWRYYLETKNPKGIQLLSNNENKTRELFELSGIPAHLIVSPDGHYCKERAIEKAYGILSDRNMLSCAVNGKESNSNTEIILLKKTDNPSDAYQIVVPDTTEYFMYKEGDKPLKYGLFVGNFFSELAKSNKLTRYIYLGIDNTIQRNDSVINMGYFITCDEALRNIKPVQQLKRLSLRNYYENLSTQY
jgi:hypothetical protein